ncbi:hypothetical protein C0585_07175 [Candidatus Woesearchaeota archaeon]|nr:MAG: hypothetical protein C0585_07175 [Candidatus Woesearchaeota archaeon]
MFKIEPSLAKFLEANNIERSRIDFKSKKVYYMFNDKEQTLDSLKDSFEFVAFIDGLYGFDKKYDLTFNFDNINTSLNENEVYIGDLISTVSSELNISSEDICEVILDPQLKMYNHQYELGRTYRK